MVDTREDGISVAVTSVEVFSALERGDPDDVLRRFNTDVLVCVEEDEHPAGRITGYVVAAHWDREHHDLRDAGDRYDGDAELLGSAADAVLDEFEHVTTALLVDLVILDKQWRGHRLARDIVVETMDVLGLDIDQTALVLVPEPMTPTGALDPGPARDQAVARLQSAYLDEGFEPWPGSARVWWLPPWG